MDGAKDNEQLDAKALEAAARADEIKSAEREAAEKACLAAIQELHGVNTDEKEEERQAAAAAAEEERQAGAAEAARQGELVRQEMIAAGGTSTAPMMQPHSVAPSLATTGTIAATPHVAQPTATTSTLPSSKQELSGSCPRR